ncbi:MAG: ribbon-helix-helix domain-containing protein [Syntrophaceae bacterium]|nr:ribbon-helix-helix domain-containing protein [Syntrophaceae bacterium]
MAKRERFTTTLDSELLQEIKILAIRNRHSTNDLLEEAISDLLNKYKDKNTKDNQAKQQSLGLEFSLHEKSSKYDKGGSE